MNKYKLEVYYYFINKQYPQGIFSGSEIFTSNSLKKLDTILSAKVYDPVCIFPLFDVNFPHKRINLTGHHILHYTLWECIHDESAC